MIPELGQAALVLAFAIALIQSIAPLAGAARRDARLAALGMRAAVIQAALVIASFAALTYSHATSDFSVLNVVENSHTAKPFIYKLTGVWGNHEGSMLLWVVILALFGAAATRARADLWLKARTLAVQGMTAAAFIAFLLFTSNPFARVSPAPANGMDLNPLLQDPGLALHPPFLYLGYVGFSIVFAFAAAGLIEGRIDGAWARAVRPFALAAWTFMTIGIALGSWWAYYELGWGGFWAWDPVENASFMPWLAGAALIHSNRALEVRGTFKAWTVLLAILAFSLSLVGTFLVRSGILTSVHAFAVDPARGVFILAILAAAVGGSLLLFALRAPSLSDSGRHAMISREGGLLLNNIILIVACATVFVGTFYPLFVDVTTGEKLSVGAPYFNLVFTPIAIVLLFAMGPGAMLAWKKADLGAALRSSAPAAVAALALTGVAAFAYWPKSVMSFIGVAAAVYAGASVMGDLARRIRIGRAGAVGRLAALPRSYLAMTIAHFSVAIVSFGVIGAGAWSSEEIRYARQGETVSVGAYDLTLASVTRVRGPNFDSDVARFSVAKGGQTLRDLEAERRFYPVRGMQTTEAAIWSRLGGDVYVTIGEPHPERGFVVRAHFYPLAGWMWAGSALMALGGLVAGAAPIRRRKTAPSSGASALAAAAE